MQIHWMLHVDSLAPSGQTSQTRGCKVKSVVEHTQKKNLEYFLPDREIAVDESTIGFKGRVAWKMYNPQKPTKWGLRVFALCDSATGYVCTFEPYYGQQTTQTLPYAEQQFPARIVLHLVDQLLQSANGDGFHLYTDRYYTSPRLATALLEKNVYLTGTVMKNRQGLPLSSKQRLKMQHLETRAWVKNEEVVFLMWQDKRQVFMLSTCFGAETEDIERRAKGGIETIEKPTMIVSYTKFMGAVDRADHYMSSYAFTRKSLKWWRKMFLWLLEVAIVNSYILYWRHSDSAQRNHLKYRERSVTQLASDVRNFNRQRRGRPSTFDHAERLNGRLHLISQLPSGQLKDCAVCSDRSSGNRHKTSYACTTCSRKPGLHPNTCFARYHTVLDYKNF